MKTISIRQPWASMIIHGFKPVENRSWKTSYKGPLLIHASLSFDHDGADWIMKNFPHLKSHVLRSKDLRGGIIGLVKLINCVKTHSSPWFFGPYGFVLQNPKPIEFNHCKGRLGLFDVPWPIEKPTFFEKQLDLFPSFQTVL